MKAPVLFCAVILSLSRALAEDDPVAAANAAWKARDFAKAAELIAKPVTEGNAAALFLKGRMAESGRGAPLSLTEAAKLYQQAMDKGNADATGAYGRLLIAGSGGLTKDETRGVFLIRKAAEAGSAAAMTILGEFAARGIGQEADPRTAVFWYERAANEKESLGYLGLAQLYDTGAPGLPKDENRGTALILEAAKLGEPLAMNEMGIRYQSGRGIAMDNVAAVGWFSLAAQHDLASAQVNLGNCYENGNGCMKDYTRAGANYAAAAKQGHALGQYMLASLFERGLGGEKNNVYAYVNYFRSAAAGFKEAELKRDELKGTLSADQLKEAGKMLETPAK
ncbi:MAG TPA: tetratricopeptide repeat protein [Verrucomicrobiales bacterium]|nr:tetratricopeptide repeat protein [Verrucomicrobiales bacterium]